MKIKEKESINIDLDKNTRDLISSDEVDEDD